MKKLGQENCVFSEMTDTEAELETNSDKETLLSSFISYFTVQEEGWL